MTKARGDLVDLDSTTYYHCINRCVRRAFLCGHDRVTGKSFEHRRAWIEKRLAKLTEVFAVELAAYAVMSNHLHLVVRVRPEVAAAWSDDEVMARWTSLFPGCRSQVVGVTETVLAEKVAEWRERLMSLSWFMRSVSAPLAQMANREDKVTGRFWEGRFKSQALLDEGAVLSCMAYVDLNAVRAGEAKSVEGSKYTSGRARVRELREAQAHAEETESGRVTKSRATPKHLASMPLHERSKRTDNDLPISLPEYLNLLRWTARKTLHHISISDAGVIASSSQDTPPADVAQSIARCGLRPETFAMSAMLFHELTYAAVGSAESMSEERERRDVAHLHGARKTTALYLAA